MLKSAGNCRRTVSISSFLPLRLDVKDNPYVPRLRSALTRSTLRRRNTLDQARVSVLKGNTRSGKSMKAFLAKIDEESRRRHLPIYRRNPTWKRVWGLAKRAVKEIWSGGHFELGSDSHDGCLLGRNDPRGGCVGSRNPERGNVTLPLPQARLTTYGGSKVPVK